MTALALLLVLVLSPISADASTNEPPQAADGVETAVSDAIGATANCRIRNDAIDRFSVVDCLVKRTKQKHSVVMKWSTSSGEEGEVRLTEGTWSESFRKKFADEEEQFTFQVYRDAVVNKDGDEFTLDASSALASLDLDPKDSVQEADFGGRCFADGCNGKRPEASECAEDGFPLNPDETFEADFYWALYRSQQCQAVWLKALGEVNPEGPDLVIRAYSCEEATYQCFEKEEVVRPYDTDGTSNMVSSQYQWLRNCFSDSGQLDCSEPIELSGDIPLHAPYPAPIISAAFGAPEECLQADSKPPFPLLESVYVEGCDGSAAQDWYTSPGGELLNQGGCLEVKEGINAGAAPVRKNLCSGEENQQWVFLLQGNTFSIMTKDGRCLSLKQEQTKTGLEARICDDRTPSSQRWLRDSAMNTRVGLNRSVKFELLVTNEKQRFEDDVEVNPGRTYFSFTPDEATVIREVLEALALPNCLTIFVSEVSDPAEFSGRHLSSRVVKSDLSGQRAGVYIPDSHLIAIGSEQAIEEGTDPDNLARISAHEIGHALGLMHSEDETTIMSQYVGNSGSPLFTEADRTRIQRLYGCDP